MPPFSVWMFDGWESWWLLTLKHGGSFEVWCFFVLLPNLCHQVENWGGFFFLTFTMFFFWRGGEGEWETLPYHHMPLNWPLFAWVDHPYLVNLVLMGSNLSKHIDHFICNLKQKRSSVSVLGRFLCSIVWFSWNVPEMEDDLGVFHGWAFAIRMGQNLRRHDVG